MESRAEYRTGRPGPMQTPRSKLSHPSAAALHGSSTNQADATLFPPTGQPNLGRADSPTLNETAWLLNTSAALSDEPASLPPEFCPAESTPDSVPFWYDDHLPRPPKPPYPTRLTSPPPAILHHAPAPAEAERTPFPSQSLSGTKPSKPSSCDDTHPRHASITKLEEGAVQGPFKPSAAIVYDELQIPKQTGARTISKPTSTNDQNSLPPQRSHLDCRSKPSFSQTFNNRPTLPSPVYFSKPVSHGDHPSQSIRSLSQRPQTESTLRDPSHAGGRSPRALPSPDHVDTSRWKKLSPSAVNMKCLILIITAIEASQQKELRVSDASQSEAAWEQRDFVPVIEFVKLQRLEDLECFVSPLIATHCLASPPSRDELRAPGVPTSKSPFAGDTSQSSGFYNSSWSAPIRRLLCI